MSLFLLLLLLSTWQKIGKGGVGAIVVVGVAVEATNHAGLVMIIDFEDSDEVVATGA